MASGDPVTASTAVANDHVRVGQPVLTPRRRSRNSSSAVKFCSRLYFLFRNPQLSQLNLRSTLTGQSQGCKLSFPP